jgi:hypothetical protein
LTILSNASGGAPVIFPRCGDAIPVAMSLTVSLLSWISSRCHEALQLDQVKHVLSEILQPDLRRRPHLADKAQQTPTHAVALGPEHMLDTNQNGLRVLLPCLWRSLSGLSRLPLRWIWLFKPLAFGAV